MARRISPKHFANLWLERSREGRPHCTENKSFAKKAIDDVCLNADLSETSWDYSYNLCQGMVRLLELGFSTKEMSSHRTLVQKLMRLGRDMMDSGIKEADFFYLGAFVDMKMATRWRNIAFFKFIMDALLGIKKYMSFFSKKLKDRIKKEYIQLFPKDFKLDFGPDLALTG